MRNLELILGATSIVLLADFSANAEIVQSGTCGGECTWTLDDQGVFSTSNRTKATGEFEFPAGTKTVSANAFCCAIGLTKITIPEGVTSIGESAFEDAKGIAEITIPNSVTSIGNWAFSYMDNLSSVTIPDSVISLGSGSFGGYNDLTDVFVSANSPLTDDMLTNAEIDLDKIVRFTTDGKYMKCNKTYASLEDYMAGNYAVYNTDGTYEKYSADGTLLGTFGVATVIPRAVKRIYTVKEANEALGTANKNTFSIRYR